MTKLSILIPSLVGRENKLAELLAVLNPQVTDEVEVVILTDNRQQPTGTKRNRLINMAQGEYIAFIDDDDMISPSYIERMMEGIRRGVDTVSIMGIYHPDDGPEQLFKAKLGSNWCTRDGVLIRGVLHLSATKRELALRFPFPNVTYREDKPYHIAMNQVCETEHEITEPIYFYNFTRKK